MCKSTIYKHNFNKLYRYFLQSKCFNIWSVIFLFVFRIWENEEKNVHNNFLSIYYMDMNMTFKCDLQIERN